MKKLKSITTEQWEDEQIKELLFREQEWAEFQRYENIVLRSESDLDGAIQDIIDLTPEDQMYFIIRHIDFTEHPQKMYKMLFAKIQKDNIKIYSWL